jgi:drug/metabolite transporter (DMT)-like permease
VLVNSAPIFAILFAWLALRAPTPRIAIAGVAVGFAGVVVMVSSQLGGGSIGHVLLGESVALLAAAGFAVGALIIGHTAARNPGLDMLGFTALQFIAGSLMLIPLAWVFGHPGSADWGSAALWESVAWVALGSSAAASVCFNLALVGVSAARATAWQFLAPVVGSSWKPRTATLRVRSCSRG